MTNYELNPTESYIVGLLIGKGIIENDNITIQFPFTNPILDGIAYCPLCGYLATKPSNSDYLKNKNIDCKN